jgi:hypothetical protein
VGERLRLGQAQPPERPRALDGEQRVLLGGIAHLGAADLALLQPRVRGLAIPRVDDEQVVVGADPVGDQVVDDAAALVREQRVLRLAVADPVEVVREQRLEQLVGVRALDVELAHVRDVEDAAVGANGPMLGDHALVLHRHLPACKGDDSRSGGGVAGVERRPQQRLGHAADCNDSKALGSA